MKVSLKEFAETICSPELLWKEAALAGFDENDMFEENEIGFCETCDGWYIGHEECPCGNGSLMTISLKDYAKTICNPESFWDDAALAGLGENDQFEENEIGFCGTCNEWFFGHEECPCGN